MENFFWAIFWIAAEFAVTGLVAKGLAWMDRTPIPQRKKKYQTVVTQRESNQKAFCATNSYRDSYWGLVSFAYQRLKQTPIYRKWRREQFDCQFGKCGICGKPMDISHTQLDHIEARCNYGTNYSDNLVLVHPKCNENKGANAGTRPNWIKENSYSKELDMEAWKILQAAREEYPDAVPDSFIRPPQSIGKLDKNEPDEPELDEPDEPELDEPDEPELDENELDEDEFDEDEPSPVANRSDSHELVLEESEIPVTISPDYLQKHLALAVRDKRQQKTYTIVSGNAREHVNPSSLFREGPETAIEHGTAIHIGDAVEGENDWDDILLVRPDAEMRAEYDPDMDSPEYRSNQYMSYDHDDWMDKYGPEC